MANTIRGEVKNLVKHGFVNLLHVLSTLDAEHYAISGRIDDAKDSYTRAVAEASKGGFLQNAAVTNERYSDYLFEIGDDSSTAEAVYRLAESIKNYDEWGATKKVELMVKKLHSVVSEAEWREISTSSLSSLKSSNVLLQNGELIGEKTVSDS